MINRQAMRLVEIYDYYVGFTARSEHTRFWAVIAFAASQVASSNNSPVFRNSTSFVLSLWIMAANFISWNMSNELWLAGPSVARPTVMPASRTARSLSVPELSLALQHGQ